MRCTKDKSSPPKGRRPERCHFTDETKAFASLGRFRPPNAFLLSSLNLRPYRNHHAGPKAPLRNFKKASHISPDIVHPTAWRSSHVLFGSYHWKKVHIMKSFWTIVFGIALISTICAGQVNFTPNWGKRTSLRREGDPDCKSSLEAVMYIYKILLSEAQKMIDCGSLNNL